MARGSATYASLPRSLPFLLGVHVWNLCDFRTPQMHIRAGGLNHKGVFTRLREPKMAAHSLRRLWSGKDAFGKDAFGRDAFEADDVERGAGDAAGSTSKRKRQQ